MAELIQPDHVRIWRTPQEPKAVTHDTQSSRSAPRATGLVAIVSDESGDTEILPKGGRGLIARVPGIFLGFTPGQDYVLTTSHLSGAVRTVTEGIAQTLSSGDFGDLSLYKLPSGLQVTEAFRFANNRTARLAADLLCRSRRSISRIRSIFDSNSRPRLPNLN